MIRLLFISVCFFLTLNADFSTPSSAEENNASTPTEVIEGNGASEVSVNEVKSKVLYLSFEEIPTRIVQGEIFSVKIKTLSTIKDVKDISYTLSNQEGIESLNYSLPYREIDAKYYYDTFYFLAKSVHARLPDFTATLIDNDETLYQPSVLEGTKLKVITLNPKKNFSNIIADSFELLDFKTTDYDTKHNIVVFMAKAKKCDIESFHLNGVYKQGIESKTESIYESKITYYAVIDKDIQNFSFSYFDLTKNDFKLIEIPIIVEDDSVTTQTDLKPKDQSKEFLKISIAASVGVIGFIVIIFRKKYKYFFLLLLPFAYIVHIAAPQKDVCIKKESNIYLLPVFNGTIFETTQEEIYLQKEGEVKNFVKIKLKDEKIGWVRNEDICSH